MIVTRGGARRIDGVHVHRSRSLTRRDVRWRDGIPVTSPARTLLDLATVLPERALRRAARQAQALKLVTIRELREITERCNGHHGAAKLRAVVADGPAPTRSPLEDVLLDLLDGAGIQRPEINAPLRLGGETIIPDFLWRDRRLAIEADSVTWHDHKLTRENDARKQAILEAHGWRVLRITHDQAQAPPAADARADPRRARRRGRRADAQALPLGSRACEHMFVPREATILHADLDAFFASVEQRDDPGLRARPVIVGGGVVLAASYEARAFGVRSAMGGARRGGCARRRSSCRPRFAAYVEASKAVKAIFDETAPIVECVSIDEAFLDVRGLQADLRHAGARSRRGCARTVREQVGLPLTRRHRDDEAAREGRQRRGEARRPAARRPRRGARVPAPAAGRAAVGRRRGDRPQAARPRHRAPSATSRAPARPRSSRSSGARRGATCTTPRSTATCGRCAPAGGGARSARSARSGATR